MKWLINTKHLFSLCFILLSALFFTSCNSDVDHPIAGHTYSTYGGSSIGSISVYAHFASNGKFDIDYMTKTYSGYDHNRYSHFKWSVSGDNITIKHDNSTYWKSSSRGTTAYTGKYNSTDNSVILDGIKYTFAY